MSMASAILLGSSERRRCHSAREVGQWHNRYAAELDDDLLQRITEVVASSEVIETLSNKHTNWIASCWMRPIYYVPSSHTLTRRAGFATS
ncbi:hypothetical protein JVX93_16530 [Mycolicibacterium boenickei]|nr:hypothetical protein JVX93_16530 [Mycolicibacterium boenickei]